MSIICQQISDMHVQNKKYRKTDKLGFRHTWYVAAATQNLEDFHNSRGGSRVEKRAGSTKDKNALNGT